MIWWKWALVVAAIPVGALGLVYAIGLALPADHVASAEANIAAPAQRIAALIRDVETYPRWRTTVSGIEVRQRFGDGLLYVERQDGDAITFDLREERHGILFRSTIADSDLPFGGQWTIALRPRPDGTAVRIEERGTVRNPIFRFFARFVIGHDATMKAYLRDLERAATS